jgi:protein-disulfide isomerase
MGIARPDRRLVALALALALPMTAGAARRRPSAPAETGMALGAPGARVTVVEYASLSCPHCARWANEVFPAFKAKYIDTGRVRFVLREFLTDPPEMAAAGWLTARCAGPKYFQVVEAIFRGQEKILAADNFRAALLAIAAANGIGEGRFDQCVTDKRALADLDDRVSLYQARDKITGTPTFFVGDRRLEGEQSLEALDEAIAAAGPAARKRK